MSRADNMFYSKLLFKMCAAKFFKIRLLRRRRCNDTSKRNGLVARMTNTRAKCILYHQLCAEHKEKYVLYPFRLSGGVRKCV